MAFLLFHTHTAEKWLWKFCTFPENFRELPPTSICVVVLIAYQCCRRRRRSLFRAVSARPPSGRRWWWWAQGRSRLFSLLKTETVAQQRSRRHHCRIRWWRSAPAAAAPTSTPLQIYESYVNRLRSITVKFENIQLMIYVRNVNDRFLNHSFYAVLVLTKF